MASESNITSGSQAQFAVKSGATSISGRNTIKNLSQLQLNSSLIQHWSLLGISKPTPVQLNCIPQILQGKDCIGCAKTGSGKTAAFALPIIHNLSLDPYGIYALVLTPTRELAIQIADQFRVLGAFTSIRVSIIVGGLDIISQGNELAKKPHVVIGTPGRIADHLNSSDTLSFKRIKYFVLDEADRLLESSFHSDLEVIFDDLPVRRQTLIFSATLTDNITKLQSMVNNNCYVWSENYDIATVDSLDESYLFIPARVRDVYLVHLLQTFTEDNKTIIVFTDTCYSCHLLTNLLRKLDFSCVSVHGDLRQGERLASLVKFKSSLSPILVCTDVASRGLDIPIVGIVINYYTPASPTDYIHRVGRTARAGQYGKAITLVSQFEVNRLLAIEEHIGKKLEEFHTNENNVLVNINAVTIARKEVELKLEESDFREKQRKNRNKRNKSENEQIINNKRYKKNENISFNLL